MMLNETKITRAIIERFSRKLLDHTEVDTAIVGGGPQAWWRPIIWQRPDRRSPYSNAN